MDNIRSLVVVLLELRLDLLHHQIRLHARNYVLHLLLVRGVVGNLLGQPVGLGPLDELLTFSLMRARGGGRGGARLLGSLLGSELLDDGLSLLGLELVGNPLVRCLGVSCCRLGGFFNGFILA